MAGATHKLAAKITELALPLVESQGLELWGVQYAVGKRILVRVFIDAAQPAALDDALSEKDEETPSMDGDASEALGRQTVDVEQCAYISRHLGLALEAEDCIPGAYTLEVSSPGLERPFFTASQMERFIGRDIEATLHSPDVASFPGRKRFVGRLAAVENQLVTLDVEGQAATFPWSSVKKAHLMYKFPDLQEKKSGSKKGSKQPS